VHWTLHACTGHTTQQALEHLAQLPPQPFDMVVTSVGVNDATAGTGTRRWRQHMTDLLHTLETRHEAGHILVSGLPPMHRFPALPQPLRWYMGLRAAALNRALQELLADHPRRRLVQVEFSEDAGLMASDGFHPGPRAYAEWGRDFGGDYTPALRTSMRHAKTLPTITVAVMFTCAHILPEPRNSQLFLAAGLGNKDKYRRSLLPRMVS
jgi:lysophospholipase L1-like esterase